MELKLIDAILIAVCILLLLMLINNFCSEGFDVKRQRAGEIVSWFNKKDNPTYVNYRKDISGGDIVEYSDMKTLHSNKKLNEQTAYEKLT
jgi:hypothetical protein